MFNKYIEQPIEVEAVQLTKENIEEIIKIMKEKIEEVGDRIYQKEDGLYIDKFYGVAVAYFGDWIIRGHDGKYHLCNKYFEIKYKRKE